ncbi:hypothetical protein CH63R_02003 [Colletotrichum higginsianum IMI 349063]|uniref:Uncharacterized protein n=2 Tax=Colletotrichum higginsianum (strain IMI 349063) TaxID=759273 RepID=A0A1B7YMK0_COLHI|nr:hypothetical protein CH63R_02003 [Colletotrichum higginsianum IMI 349063]OBR13277.1 hypothetical protein CH63R_02003 [Colletotrichum higginsianum IMI 349063]
MESTQNQPAGFPGAAVQLDVWDLVFGQLAAMECYETLASCAQLNSVLSYLALGHLYRDQFCPPPVMGSQAAKTIWASVRSSAANTHPAGQSHLSHIRHLDFLNFISIDACREVPDKGFIAHVANQLANLNLGPADDPTDSPDIVATDQVSARHPNLENVVRPLLENLCKTARERELHVLLKSLTLDRWTNAIPQIKVFQQLESLSLVFIEGLDAQAAQVVTSSLPNLRHITVVQASVPHTLDLASFLSNLKPDQLLSFSCSLNRVQVPVLNAISQQTSLRKLSLQFFNYPPVDMHVLFKLTKLTSLTLGFNFHATARPQAIFERWAETYRTHFAKWLTSCNDLRSLHLFRLPELVPAAADALPNLHLDRLHLFSTGHHSDLYEALATQQLKYLFLAEPSNDNATLEPWERRELVVKAVVAMPCLRDLRLHTLFSLTCEELTRIAEGVPNLKTISYAAPRREHPTHALKALKSFQHLTSLTVLGRTDFSSISVYCWILETECHMRPGGFSLTLPSQRREKWFWNFRGPQGLLSNSDTEAMMRMLSFMAVYDNERDGDLGDGGFLGNEYEFEEERMFVQLWEDIRGPAEALQLLRGTGPYSPFRPLTGHLGGVIARNLW